MTRRGYFRYLPNDRFVLKIHSRRTSLMPGWMEASSHTSFYGAERTLYPIEGHVLACTGLTPGRMQAGSHTSSYVYGADSLSDQTTRISINCCPLGKYMVPLSGQTTHVRIKRVLCNHCAMPATWQQGVPWISLSEAAGCDMWGCMVSEYSWWKEIFQVTWDHSKFQ